MLAELDIKKLSVAEVKDGESNISKRYCTSIDLHAKLFDYYEDHKCVDDISEIEVVEQRMDMVLRQVHEAVAGHIHGNISQADSTVGNKEAMVRDAEEIAQYQDSLVQQEKVDIMVAEAKSTYKRMLQQQESIQGKMQAL